MAKSQKVRSRKGAKVDDRYAPAEAFFRRCLGEDWQKAAPVRLSGDEVVELLWRFNEVFRPRLSEVRQIAYDPTLEAAADGAIDDLARTMDIEVLGQGPAEVVQVLLERHTQLVVVAKANELAGNPILTTLPYGLSPDQQRVGIALLLLRGMELPWPPGGPRSDGPGDLHPLTNHEDLACAIDAAAEIGDEAQLRQLGDECTDRLNTATGEERVLLHYYRSNTYAGIISSKRADADYVWSWEQPDGIENILSLRKAIAEPAFRSIDPIRASQIRTNLANRLSNLGRPVAANEHWLAALEARPALAKTLASRGQTLASYAGLLYDTGHKPLLLDAALSSFDDALNEDAIWESGDRDLVAPDMAAHRTPLAEYLDGILDRKNFDPNRWSLGSTEEERRYRVWCLQERLFLNPLNDAYTSSVAATDVLHLPDHTCRIEEEPRFPAYFNLMKQEYVSARYRLYCAIHSEEPRFVMRDVLMLDSGDSQSLGHYTEDLRSAFRSSYALFDKIGLFLNDYFQVGLNPRDTTFRRIWSERINTTTIRIRTVFDNSPNLPLRGLYFLSKDLFDKDVLDVEEPDADDLARLRNQLEHRFVSFQDVVSNPTTETHRFISIEEFTEKTLRLLKMAREALIYLSLAMHREEKLRKQASENGGTLVAQFNPMRSERIGKPGRRRHGN